MMRNSGHSNLEKAAVLANHALPFTERLGLSATMTSAAKRSNE
jgi:hypothetical protein